MPLNKAPRLRIALVVMISLMLCPGLFSRNPEVQQLAGALLGDTPMIRDLQELCDEIGGRPTGSEANLASVAWALAKFEAAGVSARKESFTLPRFWLERSCEASVSGDVNFSPGVVAMPFSIATPVEGQTAPLLDAGKGTEEDFARLGDRAKDAFILVETEELLDIEGLFREYRQAAAIEKRAFAAGVTGVVYMSSRPKGLLYRHNASLGADNDRPMLIMEREEAQRTLRLLRRGKKLNLTARIAIQSGGEYQSVNVIGEIPGGEKPQEIVIIGAHLDSWGLGTGANDNGCNAVMLLDIARQMKRLGIIPRRTIRFVLWNGEEQGLVGSWKYTLAHAEELDRHIMACSIDIGSGRISGFFTNGREELIDPVKQVLEPLRGMGPFQQLNLPVVGTDNYDFMMQGIANLVANQEPYNYGPNYHAESDTFDKVDLQQLRLNSAIVAALTLGFANIEVTWKRQTRAEIQQLIDTTDLRQEMDMFGFYPGWMDGSRGRGQ